MTQARYRAEMGLNVPDTEKGAFPSAQSLLVMAAYALVFGILAVRYFRWE